MSDDSSGLDLSALLAQAQQVQQQLYAAQQEATAQEVEGQAGGGAVRIRATGGLEFLDVTIDPAAVDPDDVEMLQDLVLAALHDTVAKANELTQQAMGGLAGLGGLLGGLGGLGGLGATGGGGGELGGLSGLSGLSGMLAASDEEADDDFDEEFDALHGDDGIEPDGDDGDEGGGK